MFCENEAKNITSDKRVSYFQSQTSFKTSKKLSLNTVAVVKNLIFNFLNDFDFVGIVSNIFSKFWILGLKKKLIFNNLNFALCECLT